MLTNKACDLYGHVLRVFYGSGGLHSSPQSSNPLSTFYCRGMAAIPRFLVVLKYPRGLSFSSVITQVAPE